MTYKVKSVFDNLLNILTPPIIEPLFAFYNFIILEHLFLSTNYERMFVYLKNTCYNASNS